MVALMIIETSLCQYGGSEANWRRAAAASPSSFCSASCLIAAGKSLIFRCPSVTGAAQHDKMSDSLAGAHSVHVNRHYRPSEDKRRRLQGDHMPADGCQATIGKPALPGRGYL